MTPQTAKKVTTEQTRPTAALGAPPAPTNDTETVKEKPSTSEVESDQEMVLLKHPMNKPVDVSLSDITRPTKVIRQTSSPDTELIDLTGLSGDLDLPESLSDLDLQADMSYPLATSSPIPELTDSRNFAVDNDDVSLDTIDVKTIQEVLGKVEAETKSFLNADTHKAVASLSSASPAQGKELASVQNQNTGIKKAKVQQAVNAPVNTVSFPQIIPPLGGPIVLQTPTGLIRLSNPVPLALPQFAPIIFQQSQLLPASQVSTSGQAQTSNLILKNGPTFSTIPTDTVKSITSQHKVPAGTQVADLVPVATSNLVSSSNLDKPSVTTGDSVSLKKIDQVTRRSKSWGEKWPRIFCLIQRLMRKLLLFGVKNCLIKILKITGSKNYKKKKEL